MSHLKTKQDLECDYLSTISMRECCDYFFENYGEEIRRDKDFFFNLGCIEINISDADEQEIYTAMAYPRKEGITDFSCGLLIHIYNEQSTRVQEDNKPIKISRDQMIEQLSRSMFDDLEMNPEKIEDYILYGCKGYENYDTDELIREYQCYISESDPENVLIEVTA